MPIASVGRKAPLLLSVLLRLWCGEGRYTRCGDGLRVGSTNGRLIRNADRFGWIGPSGLRVHRPYILGGRDVTVAH